MASRVLSACICQAYIDDDISTARPDNFTVMSHALQQRHRVIAQRRLKIHPQCNRDCLPPDATKTSANVNCRLVGRVLFLDPETPPALAAAAASPCSQCTTLSSQPWGCARPRRPRPSLGCAPHTPREGDVSHVQKQDGQWFIEASRNRENKTICTPRRGCPAQARPYCCGNCGGAHGTSGESHVK